MFCVRCGCKLDDGYQFCPQCGNKVSEIIQNDVSKDCQSELDEIADQIFWKCPDYPMGTAKILMEKTGAPKDVAKNMMMTRYKEWKFGKKSGKYPDTEYCPYCASQNIECYHQPGIVITRQSHAFKNTLISSQTKGVDVMRCLKCGREWVPKRKKQCY